MCSARLVFRNEQIPVDYTLKFVVVGEPFVGKSSILDVLSEDGIRSSREPTVGIEFYMLRGIGDPVEPMTAILEEGHDPRVVSTQYKLQVWDCAGHVRFRSIVKSYFRQAHVIIAVFDLTNRESFQMVDQWIEEIREHLIDMDELVVGLLGNKKDLPRKVSEAEAQSKAQALKCDFYLSVSAKSGENLEEGFNRALSAIHRRIINGKLELQHRSYLESRNGAGIRKLCAPNGPPREVKCSDCF